jgi:hypothetical protein
MASRQLEDGVDRCRRWGRACDFCCYRAGSWGHAFHQSLPQAETSSLEDEEEPAPRCR